jgi:hypothetical protein
MEALEFIAPMIVGVTFIVTTGAVILLRPLSRRLGELLQVMSKQKAQPDVTPELEQMRTVLSSVESRLALLEERQRFTDALLERRSDSETPALPRR